MKTKKAIAAFIFSLPNEYRGTGTGIQVATDPPLQHNCFQDFAVKLGTFYALAKGFKILKISCSIYR
jgi:hypothetical protein